jgi:predicted ATPase
LVRIDLTGQVKIEDGDRVLDESNLPGRQGRVVLARLALDPQPVHRDVLADTLWPDGPPATWERTLSGVVSRLRSGFTNAGLDLTIANAFGCYELQRPADAKLDLELAADHTDAAERALSVGDLSTAAEQGARAVTIARRPLLAGEEGEWLEAARSELRSVLVRALETHASATLGSQEAVASATEATLTEPFRETSHVLLMRAHATLGNTADALLAYERCRTLLATELGIDPSAETQALHVAMLQADADQLIERLREEGLVSLPTTTTSFIGRTAELDAVLELVTTTRLVTLTGSGGVGKTRLAVEAARSAIASFPDGVRFVDLAALTPAAPVAEHVALALGVNLRGEASARSLGGVLASQKLLLVMDNCEHVLDRAVPFVGELLDATSDVVVLVTSRSPLDLPSEHVWHVPSLGLPVDDDDLETAAATDALAMFCARAGDVRAGFTATSANVGAIASICRRLDGVPLAIELAAARIGAMSVAEIAEHLDERFEFTVAGSVDRQRTLRTTIDWSYDQLGRREAGVFRSCSAFEGSFTIDDAIVVCGDDVGVDLARLAERSLVHIDTNDLGTRYRMLETIKEYARDRAAGTDEYESALDAHIGRFAALVPELEGSLDQAGFLDAIEPSRADVTAAIHRALERGRLHELIAIAGAFWRYYVSRGQLTEGRTILERAIEAARVAGLGDEIGGLSTGLYTIVFNLGDLDRAEALVHESIDLWQRLGDDSGRALALANLASLAQAMGRPEATQIAGEALELADAVGQHAAGGLANLVLGVAAGTNGDADGLRACASGALERFTRAGNLSGVARALVLQAATIGEQGSAREVLDEALSVSRRIDDKLTEGMVLLQVGTSLAEDGMADEALGWLQQGLRLTRRIGNRRSFLECVEQIGCVVSEWGDAATALQLLGAADALRTSLSIKGSYSNVERLERLVARARKLAGDVDDAQWKRGTTFSFDQAFEVGMAVSVEPSATLVPGRNRDHGT